MSVRVRGEQWARFMTASLQKHDTTLNVIRRLCEIFQAAYKVRLFAHQMRKIADQTGKMIWINC